MVNIFSLYGEEIGRSSPKRSGDAKWQGNQHIRYAVGHHTGVVQQRQEGQRESCMVRTLLEVKRFFLRKGTKCVSLRGGLASKGR